MDEGGYDAVWLAEHHFSTYSVCPSVHIMGTHVAAKTKNLRIGTAVSLAAMYHPLRLAEEVALLDMLSGGRVNWGAGRGFDQREFRSFGVPIEESAERFLEAVDVVLAAWQGPLEFHGKFWNFADVEVLPRPLQQPRPPVWLAATSPESIRNAAQRGHDILMDPHSSHGEIARKRRIYADALAEFGFPTEGRTIPIGRLLAIAPTDAEAARVAEQGADWTLASYVKGPPPGGETRFATPKEHYMDDVIIHGSPAKVVDKLLALKEEMPLDYLLCSPLSHETFMLFTNEVLPKLV
jgi:alkanesulfonate monooxygenase SsuD/methylene tetrahydromethanopterin reductase-like flavin-dependent oxidoreductase (luciferase family)